MYADFIAKWRSVFHHVTGQHEWNLGEGGKNVCDHTELTEGGDKPLIKKGSAVHKALRSVILNLRFLKTIPYFLRYFFSLTLYVRT